MCNTEKMKTLELFNKIWGAGLVPAGFQVEKKPGTVSGMSYRIYAEFFIIFAVSQCVFVLPGTGEGRGRYCPMYLRVGRANHQLFHSHLMRCL